MHRSVQEELVQQEACEISQTVLRCLSRGDVCGFEYMLEDGFSCIEISSIRVTDLSRTRIYIEIRADRLGAERHLSPEQLDALRPHVISSVESLRAEAGQLPLQFLKEVDGGDVATIENWLGIE